MASTVTIDKAYFETLLRRAEFHVSGEDLTTPVDLPTVTIPKCDHDNLLRMAQEYSTLRDALYRGGIAPETLEILINGDDAQIPAQDEDADGMTDIAGGVALRRPQQPHPRLQTPLSNLTNASNNSYKQARGYPGNGYGYDRRGSHGRDCGASHDDTSFPSDVDKDDQYLGIPSSEKQYYGRNEQRTILIKNLSDRVTHKDIVDIIRGGALLDVYLRTNDRSASISFVEGAAAQAFMAYAKRNDIYIHGKRAELQWNERQFILPGHVAGKIQSGATRNLIVRSIHPNITPDRIREDLEHIHNLVVIDIKMQNADALISLNSVHNSLFARTCMMSRGTYKGSRIEWYADECAQALPKIQYVPRREPVTAPVKKANNMVNRFQMLNMDGTETGSEDDDEGDLTSYTSMTGGATWASSTVAA